MILVFYLVRIVFVEGMKVNWVIFRILILFIILVINVFEKMLIRIVCG